MLHSEAQCVLLLPARFLNLVATFKVLVYRSLAPEHATFSR